MAETLRHDTKKGQNYINSGLSDEALYLCVKDGKSYLCAYYNSHNWKIDPDDKYEKCVIKKGGKVIKNYGYMDSRQYNTAKNSYRYKSTVKFVKKHERKPKENINSAISCGAVEKAFHKM